MSQGLAQAPPLVTTGFQGLLRWLARQLMDNSFTILRILEQEKYKFACRWFCCLWML